MTWTSRDFTVAECAALSGIHRANIDLIIHRAKGCEVLFSEKRGYRRWFSPRDIAVLRIAFEFERGGRSWLSALGTAFDHLQEPPPADALLVLTPAPVRASGGPRIISDRDVPRLPIERSTLLVPIGKIVAEIVDRCAHIKETPVVAVQS
ncbi:MAG: hypothetical protein ABS58_09315 [Mesorhizobium sp. SCN 65-20]|nr:MAG: hypothetical protein ABS58_09315 [Mesorhizobium sp. SCN 65-20]